MKSIILICLLFFVSPVREVEKVRFAFSSRQHDIFLNYSNDNFSQKLVFDNNTITAETKSSDFFQLDLDFRVFPREKYMETLDREVKAVVLDLFKNERSLKKYLTNISRFLAKNIQYSEKKLPQDAASVIFNKKAYCIGFSNVVTVFLDSAGIKNKFVKGFYLKKGNNNTLVPVPHRWVEIHLANGSKFFYDPQYQKFSANYIATKDDVDFKQVKKFKVYVIKKSKKIMN